MPARSATWIIPAYAGSTGVDGIPEDPRGGSSPHTRGARYLSALPLHVRGDHPRIRGEHRATSWPPRKDPGIIPAYAGSTQYGNAMDVHVGGSSPHTRGARRRHGGHQLGAGIIPAYAGSTHIVENSRMSLLGSSPRTRGARRGRTSSTGARWDHPRVRGEHPGVAAAVRGRAGIIPAYAGSTSWAYRARTSRWDHPRVRGEHLLRLAHEGRLGGSSPRTRGVHQPAEFVVDHVRIIPAYAGSTSAPRYTAPAWRDHPRVRGEHKKLRPGELLVRGSSPRTRGALWLHRLGCS